MNALADYDAGLTLVIEASTAAGSVALLRGDTLLQRREAAMGASREDALFPAVQSALEAEDVDPEALACIVCGDGPGSFTSLRIAAAIAKGFAHAHAVPLFAVSSLLLAAASHGHAGEFVVHANALRGERYALPVRIDEMLRVQATGAVVRVAQSALDELVSGRSRLVVLEPPLTLDESRVVPDASQLARISGWRRAGRVSLREWEPGYGRLAEAQVKWEATHQRALPTSP